MTGPGAPWHPRRRAPRDEVGAATVLVLAMAGVLLFVLVGLSAAAGLVTAQRRAQAAADLAALAGATAVPGADGCAEAARISTANGAALDACSVVAREVWVQVTVPGPRWPGRRVRVSAEARAGPR